MANFGSSFAESFESSYKTSSDASLELLKEKMKADQTKAENRLKGTTLNNAIIASAAASGDESLLKETQTIVDALGDSAPDASKIVFKSLQDRIKQANKAKDVDAGNKQLIDMMNKLGTIGQPAQTDVAGKITETVNGVPAVAPFDMSISTDSSGRIKPTLQPRTADEIQQKQLAITKLQQQTNPDFQASVAAKKDLEKEYIKTSGNIESAFTGLNDSFNQLNKALPNSNLDKYPNVVSKLFGSVQELGTKTGLTTNKELAPAIARLKGNAYKLARALDPSGRISDKDLEASVGQIFNAKQSASERKNNLINLMFDVASTMRPEQRERLAAEKPELAEGFKSIGLDFVSLKREDTITSGDTKKSFSSLWS